MGEELKDYQVMDVFCGGTLYKVRHKRSGNMYTWKAVDCSSYSDQQINNIVYDIKVISELSSVQGLYLSRYYDTIVHDRSKTMYWVTELLTPSLCLDQLFAICEKDKKYFKESFIWHLLHTLARIHKAVQGCQLNVITMDITLSSIFLNDDGDIRINCFNLGSKNDANLDTMRQIGTLLHNLCHGFLYSDELKEVIKFLLNDRNVYLRPDVILYHPTVLANLENHSQSHRMEDILLSDNIEDQHLPKYEEINDKALEVHKRNSVCTEISLNSTYRISPDKRISIVGKSDSQTLNDPLSPTLAALALELPGFVPRCRKPFNRVILKHNSPQEVSERTLSQQWMSRLIALRQREETLNRREIDLITKEIINSPNVKVIPLKGCEEVGTCVESNGITLPPVITSQNMTRESAKGTRSKRKKRLDYEDMDSSLSADPGDDSIIITATKFTKENIPRRIIFPETSSKKVSFASNNPFIESDDSVTLTFYELEKSNGSFQRETRSNSCKLVNKCDINQFKYMDMEKLASDKCAAMHKWHSSSPSKQLKLSKKIFADITNRAQPALSKSPSKCSLTSKSSATSRSKESEKSQEQEDGGGPRLRKTRMSLMSATSFIRGSDLKKSSGRKSLLPFKTPFKF